MNDLQKALEKSKSISREIEELLRMTNYEFSDDLSGLKIDYNDEEQVFLLNELRNIINNLAEAKQKINYLIKPITHTGYLHKNSRGRYETEYHEYTSGDKIEVLIDDDIWGKHWVLTRVEHDSSDYYLVGYKQVPMEGLKVRTRK